MIRWVYDARAATREQLQRLFFSAGAKTRCQHRLMLLHRNHYLDRLPRRSSSEPDVYYISRRAYRGLRELRAMGHANAKPVRLAPLRVPHILDISTVRAAFTAACNDAGFDLTLWIDEVEIAEFTSSFGFIPDGYFKVRRFTRDGEKQAAFFVEVERSGKSNQALTDRFTKYATFYYEGHYERLFGTKALRVLFLVASEYGINPVTQVDTYSKMCERSGATFFRFTGLENAVQTSNSEVLTSPIWCRPSETTPVSLFLKD